MGQCVVRDCGYDPARRMPNQRFRAMDEEHSQSKYPVLRASTEQDQEEAKEEDHDIYKEIRRKYRQKSKIRLLDSEGGTKYTPENKLENYHNNEDTENEQGDDRKQYSPNSLREIERELYEVMYSTASRNKDQRSQVDLANKPTVVKPVKYFFNSEAPKTFRKNRIMTNKSSNTDRRDSDSSLSGGDTPEKQAQNFGKSTQMGKQSRSRFRKNRSTHSSYYAQDQSNSNIVMEEKSSLFEESIVNQSDRVQRTTKEIAEISNNMRGRHLGFENVFFKDIIKNAKSRTQSPQEITRFLPDEISDSDFDFDQFDKSKK